ncbi:MAG: non-canonical purine NTP diphosphatase [Duncaniella sp.]|nr:non-canonical purine NTP diphosphatase [Duncaniella sp.]
MSSIVFATNNPHKLAELREIVGDRMEILSLAEIGCHEDIPETADTLEGNALIKARHIREKYGYDCFADDTGLMVDALGGQPGVYSARYAGPECDSAANVALLLDRLKGVGDRSARFKTVIALELGGKEYVVEGKVEGKITEECRGESGFGYDPVFQPEGSGKTFAQMTDSEKNAVSHRGRATAELLKILLKEQI